MQDVNLTSYTHHKKKKKKAKKKIVTKSSKRALTTLIFANLFYYSAYFYNYSWAPLHFLVLFMGLTVLFQLTFTFIYNTFSKKFSVLAK